MCMTTVSGQCLINRLSLFTATVRAYHFGSLLHVNSFVSSLPTAAW